MNRSLRVVVGIACVFLLGLGVFVYVKKTHIPKKMSEIPTEKGIAKNLEELLRSGVTQKCTFKETTIAPRVGTIYMTAGRMRGDFTVPNGAKSAHILTDGDEERFWSDSESQGVVVKYRRDTPMPLFSNTLDVTTPIEYMCEEWIADEALLLPPREIVFRSEEDLVPRDQIVPSGAGDTASSSQVFVPAEAALDIGVAASTTRSAQCRLCDKVTSKESQQECFVAFKCAS